MKSLLKIFLPVLILTISLSVFMVLRASKPEQPAVKPQERVWRVEVQEVAPQILEPTLTLYGQVETQSLFKAAAPAASRVERVLVQEGQSVAEGQLLISLDPRDFLPRLQQAQAEVTKLQAELDSERIRQESDLEALEHERKLLQLARQGVERARQLQTKKLGSESELDQALQQLTQQSLLLTNRERSITDHPARVQALEARLSSAVAGLDQAKLDYERSQVKAPYPGLIASVETAVGNQVSASQQLLTMYDSASLELRARIPEPYLDELEQSLESGLPLLGYAGLGSRQIRLRLLRLAGEADPSGTDALFAIEQAGDWLRSGQTLQFRLQRRAQGQALAVPFSAIYGEDRAYKLVEGRMQGVKLRILGSYMSEAGDELLLVRSEQLAAGDLLVVTHLPNAMDGLRVESVISE